MKLNRSTDMALRIAMLTAASPARTTVDELAEQLALPRSHVAKVVQRLQRIGVLVTIRGRSGGVAIAEAAGEVTVGAVVRAFEGDDEVVSCEQPACPWSPAAGCVASCAARRRRSSPSSTRRGSATWSTARPAPCCSPSAGDDEGAPGDGGPFQSAAAVRRR